MDVATSKKTKKPDGSIKTPSKKTSDTTVFLGMSGGVDSAVSAVLLREQGYNVVGVYMKNWSRDLPGMQCPWAEDLADAKRVAVKLGIDFRVFDFEAEYRDKVVQYMLDEFRAGRTPNPDIMCNQEVKFKLFYKTAREEGADLIATGHYARVGDVHGGDRSRLPLHSTTGAEGKLRLSLHSASLLRAVDENKDQTYFLYRISEEALAHTLFPVGEMLKPEVKKLAATRGLAVAHKKESMGVCFVGEVGIKDFLKEYIPETPGEIREAETGKILGMHEGAVFYTVGQRHGLNVGGGLPYYVVKKDIKSNIIYVSKNLNYANLWAKELILEDVVLRTGRDETRVDEMPVEVRLRHRASLVPAQLKVVHGCDEMAMRVRLVFDRPVKAPAAGQSVVCYLGEVCVGGGVVYDTIA